MEFDDVTDEAGRRLVSDSGQLITTAQKFAKFCMEPFGNEAITPEEEQLAEDFAGMVDSVVEEIIEATVLEEDQPVPEEVREVLRMGVGYGLIIRELTQLTLPAAEL
jgi:hypothetical protein